MNPPDISHLLAKIEFLEGRVQIIDVLEKRIKILEGMAHSRSLWDIPIGPSQNMIPPKEIVENESKALIKPVNNPEAKITNKDMLKELQEIKKQKENNTWRA